MDLERNYGFWKGFLGRNEDEREEVLAASSMGDLEMESQSGEEAVSVKYLKVPPFKGTFGCYYCVKLFFDRASYY